MKINKAFIVGSVIAVSLCLLVGGVSGFITRMAIPVWYAGLENLFSLPPMACLHRCGPRSTF